MISKIKNQYQIYSDKLSRSGVSTEDLGFIFKKYRLQLSIFQHERIIHLIITMFVVLFSLIFCALVLITPQTILIFAAIPLIILTGFYIFHYYRLENEVQAFESLSEKLFP